MTIKIIVAGPRGKMGVEAVHMINDKPSLQLTACIDRRNNGKHHILPYLDNLNIPVYTDAHQCFQSVDADVFIDLTEADAGYNHAKIAIEHRIRPVVGTSGMTKEQLHELKQRADKSNIGCIIAPNFAIGAVLMMQFAKMAAKHFPDVEIIEKHHDQKLDAPSGSAVKIADLIRSNRPDKQQGHPDEKEVLEGSRGANINGMHIHSVRLPGIVAQHEIIFGGPGQTLTLKHDSHNRDSFMEGLKLAVNKVTSIDEYVYGLENVLDE